MAKSTTTRRGTKATAQRTTKAATRAPAHPANPTQIGGAKIRRADMERLEPQIGKVTDQILMFAADAEGISFIINRSSFEFFIEHDHPNYAAMVSTLLAGQASGADVAVKYSEFGGVQSNRRRAIAVAKGVHAVISGGSF